VRASRLVFAGSGELYRGACGSRAQVYSLGGREPTTRLLGPACWADGVCASLGGGTSWAANGGALLPQPIKTKRAPIPPLQGQLELPKRSERLANHPLASVASSKRVEVMLMRRFNVIP